MESCEDQIGGSQDSVPNTAGPLRRSGRRRKAPKLFVPEGKDSSNKWEGDEKKRLLEALMRDNGKYDWASIASHVQTKTVDQVKNYVRRITARAKGTATRSHDTSPIDEWISLADKLSQDSATVRQCLSQTMHLAAVEPRPPMSTGSSTPNYSLIYKYLACLIDGQTGSVPNLPQTESVVVLDLVRDLMQHLSSCNIRPQNGYVRRTYPRLLTKATSNSQPAMSSDTQQPASTDKTSISHQADLQPALLASLQSFNPFEIPVTLLNPTQEVTADDIMATD